MSRRGPPPDTSKMVSLKVDGLSHRCSAEDLEGLFDRYGKIGDCYIPKDFRTKESRGFGFVRYFSKNDAEDAIDALDGRKYDGRELSVQYARYDRPENERRWAGGRDRSRSRSGGRGRDRSRSRSGGRGRRDRSDSRDRAGSRDRGGRGRDRSDSRDKDRGSDRRRRHSSNRSDDSRD